MHLLDLASAAPRHARTMTLVVASLFATTALHATSALWTSTSGGSQGAWTDGANWNAGGSSYPGLEAANQAAYLTQTVASATYTAVVNSASLNPLGVVQVRNYGAGGEADLIITNAVVTMTNLFLRGGGRVEIDSQGVLTNSIVTLDGTNAQLVLNGGALCTTTNPSVGTLVVGSAGGRGNVLTFGDNSSLICSGLTNTLLIGSSSGGHSNQVVIAGTNVLLRTTYAPVIGNGSSWNTMLVTGSATWDFVNSSQGRVGQSGGTSNLLLISGGTLMLTNNSTFTIGYSIGNNCNNQLIVTNGGRFYSRSSLAVAYQATNNAIIITGSNSLCDLSGGASVLTVASGGGTGNVFLVDQGAVVSNACAYVSGGGGMPANNRLVLTNGSRWYGGAATTSPKIGQYGSNNLMVVTGSGSLMDLTNTTLYIGYVTGSTNMFNTLRVENGGTIFGGNGSGGAGSAAIIVGDGHLYTGYTYGNTLLVTNGGQILAPRGASYVGYYAPSNLAVVTGAGSLWDCGNKGLTVGQTVTGSWNTARIEAGGVLSNFGGGLTVGYSGSYSNSLIVAGGQLYGVAGGTSCYIGNSSSSNVVLVTGAGSLWNCNTQALYVGTGSGIQGNALRIDNGGVVINVGVTRIGYTGAINNNMVVTGGAQTFQGIGGDLSIGDAGHSNTLDVTGNNTLMYGYAGTSGRNFNTGINGATGNTSRVGGGASLVNWGNVIVGRASTTVGASGPVGNTLIITNGGFVSSSTARAGDYPNNCWSNTLLVVDGGVLEANTLDVNFNGAAGPYGDNTITNNGGIYQFTTNAGVTINLGPTGTISIVNGTISFRNIADATVLCNQSGGKLDSATKMSFAGNNAFRLNNATNTASSKQTYLFDTGTPTNFCRLEMVNGATRYRGQAGNTLTIGPNGQLFCSNTAATVDLAFTNNGTLTLISSTLALATNATLNGTLTIDLDHLATTAGVLNASALTLTANSTLSLIGASATNETLVTYSGTLGGNAHFGSIVGIPNGYQVQYGNGTISLRQNPPTGSVVLFF